MSDLPIVTAGAPAGVDRLIDLLLSGLEELPLWRGFLAALSDRLGTGPAAFIFQRDNDSFADAPIVVTVLEALSSHQRLFESGLLRSVDYDWPQMIEYPGSESSSRWCVLRMARDRQRSAWLISSDTGRLAPDWAQVLTALVPFLQRLLRLQDMMADCERRLRIAEHVLETSDVGVVIVDAKAVVFSMTDTARALLAKSKAIAVRGGVLRAVRPSEDAILSGLIREMAEHQAPSPDSSRYVSLSLDRDDQPLPLTIIVRPGPPHAPLTAPFQRSATVILRDPARRIMLAGTDLEQLFGLTGAEARLASLLADGFSVEEAAQIAKISRNTARVQLQKIFSKTETRRQGELIRLLLGSVAALARTDADVTG